MSPADTAFLTLVVVAFVGYGVVLFTAWLMVERDAPKRRGAGDAPAASKVEKAKPPRRAAA
jgi:hypothetical protein